MFHSSYEAGKHCRENNIISHVFVSIKTVMVVKWESTVGLFVWKLCDQDIDKVIYFSGTKRRLDVV